MRNCVFVFFAVAFPCTDSFHRKSKVYTVKQSQTSTAGRHWKAHHFDHYFDKKFGDKMRAENASEDDIEKAKQRELQERERENTPGQTSIASYTKVSVSRFEF